MGKNETKTGQMIYEGLRRYRGSITKLAKEHKCTPEWVRHVLLENRKDEDLILKASKLWLQLEEERSKQLKSAAETAKRAAALAQENDTIYAFQQYS